MRSWYTNGFDMSMVLSKLTFTLFLVISVTTESFIITDEIFNSIPGFLKLFFGHLYKNG